MKSVIFSIYIDIDQRNLERLEGYLGDGVSRSDRTKHKLKQYYQPLYDVKKKYAELCGAEYVVFGKDDQYNNFVKQHNHNQYEFDCINFYKIYLMEKLANEYDQVLYLDFDVVPSTDQSFFDAHDMTKFCIHCINASKENTWGIMNVSAARGLPCEEHACVHSYDHVVQHHLDRYHWYIKKLCKDAMLLCDGLHDANNLLANTAIMGGSSTAIHSIKFFERMPHMLQTYQNAVQENAMGTAITDKFFVNNEVFMTYLINKYNLECCYLPSSWHYVQLEIYRNFASKSESHLLHVVDKQFERIWRSDV